MIIAKDIKSTVEAHGYKVAGMVTTGEEAVIKTGELLPDLIIMDVKLKGELDGIDAALQIKDLYDTPVVYLTSYVDNKTIGRAKITGPLGYILKPYEEIELCTALEIALYKDSLDKKMREHERWLSTILRSIGDAVIATDRYGSIKFINPVAEHLTGWTADETLNRPLSDIYILKETNLPPASDNKREAFADSSFLSEQRLLLRRDRREIPVDETSAPIINEKGEVTGTVLVFNDVSERHQVQMRLRESEELYRTLAEAAQENIYTVDAAGRIIYANSFAATNFGVSQESIVGMHLFDLYPSHVAEDFIISIRKIFESGSFQNQEEKLSLHSKEVWFEYRLYPIYSSDGAVKAVLVISRDITSRKKVEEYLKMAKEQAEAASIEKNRFLAHISHEIRTPLNAIIGFSELLRDSTQTSNQKDYINVIHESGNVLMALIEDILDISRIESGMMRLQTEIFNLEYVVNNVVKILRLRLKSESVIFVLDFDHHLAKDFTGDPTRISQILLNLLNNALKFTEKGEVFLSLTAGELSPDRKSQKINLKVRDTGIGIPYDKQRLIFDAFIQADSSTTRKYGGTGLGLTITKAVVEKMGGVISCNSEVGKGSEFNVTLSLAGSDTPAAADDYSSHLRNVESKRAVVIDRSVASCLVMEKYLKRLNMFCAGSFQSLKEAMIQIRQAGNPLDFIFVDVSVLDQGGQESLIAIKNECRTDLGLIAVYSGIKSTVLSKLKKLEFDAYLARPVIWNEFAAACEKLLLLKDESPRDKENADKGILSLKGIHVLLAEDNFINQKLEKILLVNLGCTVDLANNGREAVQKVSNNHYDAVIMDVSMPVLGGIEATVEIRKAGYTDLPIVALTAFASKEDERKCMEAGMDGFIAKPIKVRDLEDILTSILKRQS